jgi:hypothetical protein
MRRDIADPNQKLNRGDQCPRFGIDDVSRALATIAKATTDLSGSCLQTSCSRARGREQAGGNDYPTRLSASETLGSTPSQVIALCGLLTRRRTGVVAVWPKIRMASKTPIGQRRACGFMAVEDPGVAPSTLRTYRDGGALIGCSRRGRRIRSREGARRRLACRWFWTCVSPCSRVDTQETEAANAFIPKYR